MVNTNSGDLSCLRKSLQTVWIQIAGPDLDQCCLAQFGRGTLMLVTHSLRLMAFLEPIEKKNLQKTKNYDKNSPACKEETVTVVCFFL